MFPRSHWIVVLGSKEIMINVRRRRKILETRYVVIVFAFELVFELENPCMGEVDIVDNSNHTSIQNPICSRQMGVR